MAAANSDSYAASVVMCIAYGRRLDSMDAQVLKNVDSAMEFIGSLNVPGAYLAETLPFLARLPTFLAPWKGLVLKRGIEDANLFGNLGMEVKERSDAGKSVPDCFVKSVVDVLPPRPSNLPPQHPLNLVSWLLVVLFRVNDCRRI
jgi:hypothetical protein